MLDEQIRGTLVLPKKPQLQIVHGQSVLDFGIMTPGTEKSIKFGIKNCGQEPLDISFSTTESWITIVPSHITAIGKEEVKEIIVKANPGNVSPGKHKVKLVINSNDLLEKTKFMYILLQIEERINSIEIHPNFIDLNKILLNSKYKARVEVINVGDESEAASIDVDIDPEMAQWLSYEITSGKKKQLYINFEIDTCMLRLGEYKKYIRIKELFSSYSLPLELPISFTIVEHKSGLLNNYPTNILNSGPKQKIIDFFKKLIMEEEEENNILYTDTKTYSLKQNIFVYMGIFFVIIVSVILLIIRLR